MMNQKDGPRDFAVFISQLAEGEANGELSKQLHELVVACQEKAEQVAGSASGEIKLNIRVKVDARGVAVVGWESVQKLPKEKRAGATMWVTKGGNLTPENPRQQSMFVKEVPLHNEERIIEESNEVKAL